MTLLPAVVVGNPAVDDFDVRTAAFREQAFSDLRIGVLPRDTAGKVLGLNHEGVFYDPEALVEPIRMTRTLERVSGFESGEPYTFIECVQTIYPVNGLAKPVVAGTVIPFKVPDMYGRPWAKNWEKNFEAGWDKPEDSDLPAGILDIFK